MLAFPNAVDVCADRTSGQGDLLTHVNSLILQRHSNTPHVGAADVLREVQLDVVDLGRLGLRNAADFDILAMLHLECRCHGIRNLDLVDWHVGTIFSYAENVAIAAFIGLDTSQGIQLVGLVAGA